MTPQLYLATSLKGPDLKVGNPLFIGALGFCAHCEVWFKSPKTGPAARLFHSFLVVEAFLLESVHHLAGFE